MNSGVPLNPMAVEGQIEGGIVQGMGKALYEEYVFGNGAILNPNFTDYRIPTALDVPEIKVILVETEDPNGPYGSKSVGELALVPTPAAIANAVYDAIGVRLTTLPMTPERVLEALKQRQASREAGASEPASTTRAGVPLGPTPTTRMESDGR